MVLDPGSIGEIEDVSVYLERGNERYETDLRTVRDEFYGMIDDFLDNNSYGSRSMGTGSMGRSKEDQNNSQSQQDYSEWLESLEDVDVEMDIQTPSGVVTVQVAPRTDFDLGEIQTSPNVMKVKHNGSTEYAIREWNHYLQADPEELVGAVDELGWGMGAKSRERGRSQIEYQSKPHDQFGPSVKSYNMGTTDILSILSSNGKNFNRNSHDDALYDTIGTGQFNSSDFEGSLVMIPELLLESAMHKEEGIEHEIRNNELATPVTPSNIKILDLYDDKAFALRPWGNNATDGGIYDSEEQWGDLYGTMEGLGLVSTFDRKDEFMEEQLQDGTTALKFFDPEVVGYTENDRWFKGADWDDFTDQLSRHANAKEESLEKIKDRKNRVANSFDNRINVLDEIPSTIDRDLFPRDKLVETRV